MTDLTPDERNLVRDLLEEAEDKGYGRERYRAIVSAALDERRTDPRALEQLGVSRERPADIGLHCRRQAAPHQKRLSRLQNRVTLT
jgi:hypothetical protein